MVVNFIAAEGFFWYCRSFHFRLGTKSRFCIRAVTRGALQLIPSRNKLFQCKRYFVLELFHFSLVFCNKIQVKTNGCILVSVMTAIEVIKIFSYYTLSKIYSIISSETYFHLSDCIEMYAKQNVHHRKTFKTLTQISLFNF